MKMIRSGAISSDLSANGRGGFKAACFQVEEEPTNSLPRGGRGSTSMLIRTNASPMALVAAWCSPITMTVRIGEVGRGRYIEMWGMKLAWMICVSLG